MAGDWIKFEHVTPDKPEIHRIAEMLNLDSDTVVGKLLRFWIWTDQQAVDCNALSVTKNLIDRITFAKGFADALLVVGWLIDEGESFKIPNFDRHNGQTAKRRAFTNRRVANFRQKSNGDSVTNVTLEPLRKALPEKRREDSTEEDKSSSVSQTDAKASWSENGGFEIPESVLLRLQKAYPACDVERQAARAHEWLLANPLKRKKDHHRFLVSWLGRAQERGGDVASRPIGGRNARFGEVMSALDHAAQNPVKREAPPGWRDLLLEMADDPDMVPESWEECYPSVQKYAIELYERKGEVA